MRHAVTVTSVLRFLELISSSLQFVYSTHRDNRLHLVCASVHPAPRLLNMEPIMKICFALLLAFVANAFVVAPAFARNDCYSFLETPAYQRPVITFDKAKEFVAQIRNHWAGEFAKRHWDFRPARVVLYQGYVQTACGPATDKGPFYCGGDETIYLDLSWFENAAHSVGQPTEMMLALVLSHEYGHHLQILRGGMDRGMQIASYYYGYRAADFFYPRMEFQADCLAGVFIRKLFDIGRIHKDEALQALAHMAPLGDDFQASLAWRRGQIPSRPSYSHGTSEERMTWFGKGLNGGALEVCEPFGVPVLK